MAAVPSSLRIHIQEIGYATSTANLSSETAQAQFFCYTMKAWDDYQSRITHLAILRMNDVTRTQAEALSGPYGLTADGFIEYLRSLGLRTSTGIEKSSFSLLKSELYERGF